LKAPFKRTGLDRTAGDFKVVLELNRMCGVITDQRRCGNKHENVN
jgi:hypothetical protein